MPLAFLGWFLMAAWNKELRLCCKSRSKERSKELKWSYGRVEKVFLQLNAVPTVYCYFKALLDVRGRYVRRM